ncbi:hypothetical protein [Terrabacter sp. BE26]|uniref:hypothetical protein n=1 Tax=Terrabacter sp. BE26 TaxID=2898152 RepID=UPI0035BE4D47
MLLEAEDTTVELDVGEDRVGLEDTAVELDVGEDRVGLEDTAVELDVGEDRVGLRLGEELQVTPVGLFDADEEAVTPEAFPDHRAIVDWQSRACGADAGQL